MKIEYQDYAQLVVCPGCNRNHVDTCIKGRQFSAARQAAADPSPLVSLDLEKTLEEDRRTPVSVEYTEMRQKCLTKWVGPQGRPLKDLKAFTESREGYFRNNSPISVPSLSESEQAILQLIYRKFRPSGWRCNRHDLWHFLCHRPHGTNTGYMDFTSDETAKVRQRTLLHALDYAEEVDLQVRNGSTLYLHPAIEWYRDMRQKYRHIFGDSLGNIAIMYKYLGYIVHDGIYSVPVVAWRSWQALAQELELYVRRFGDNVDVCEGDFEHMDECCSMSNSIPIMIALATQIWGCSPEEVEALERALVLNFHIPLWPVHATTIDMRAHSEYSGVFTTNGLEDHINIFQSVRSFVRTCEELSEDPLVVWHRSYFRVQGDDSVLAVFRPPVGWRDIWKKQYAITAAENHLVVQAQKLRVSKVGAFFCRHYFPIYKGVPRSRDLSGVSIPMYNVELALNNIMRPESGPLIAWRDSADHTARVPDYTPELQRYASVLDNCIGDPLYKRVVGWIGDQVGWKTWNAALQQSSRLDPRMDWRTKVFGADRWDPAQSPTSSYVKSRAE